MVSDYDVIDEVAGLYRVIALRPLRRTLGVAFDVLPLGAIDNISAIDRLIHQPGALSPGTVGDVARPWYMHTHQADHLVVLHGRRDIQLFTEEHGRIESLLLTHDRVEKNGELLHDGAAMVAWPVRVFHRIRSSDAEGSRSVNVAAHYEGFDIRTNFSIYDLDTETGRSKCIREGYLDQPQMT